MTEKNTVIENMKENNELAASSYSPFLRANYSELLQKLTLPKLSLVPAFLNDSQPKKATLLGSPEVGVDRVKVESSFTEMYCFIRFLPQR